MTPRSLGIPRPSVRYVGPDAAAVAERLNGPALPFDVRAVDPDAEWPSSETDPFDCLVCVSDGQSDALDIVDLVRAESDSIPVVVLATEAGVDAATAVEHGVSNVISVPADFDPVSELQSLEPLIERVLRDGRERSMLNSLLENIPLGVYFKDRESRHVRLSDSHLRLGHSSALVNEEGKIHHTPADVVGKTDFDLLPNDIAVDTVADDREVVETGESVQKVEDIGDFDYQGTYVQTTKAPWYDDAGQLLGVVGVTKDVSDREQYRLELEHQNERLERVTRALSHDLRNPLAVAEGRLEFLEETAEGEDAEHVEAIGRSLCRMNELIEDVLTLARQGEAVRDPDVVSLATVARDAWDVVESDGATLEIQTDATVHADAGRVKQVFENLFRNAVEHGRDGERELTVTVGDLTDPAGFFVADDGVGIPEADQDSVFDSGFSTATDGTGFGLDIVRTIADAHGWGVSVTDSADGGARFEFEPVDVVSA